jgi:hypothetical protein
VCGSSVPERKVRKWFGASRRTDRVVVGRAKMPVNVSNSAVWESVDVRDQFFLEPKKKATIDLDGGGVRNGPRRREMMDQDGLRRREQATRAQKCTRGSPRPLVCVRMFQCLRAQPTGAEQSTLFPRLVAVMPARQYRTVVERRSR